MKTEILEMFFLLLKITCSGQISPHTSPEIEQMMPVSIVETLVYSEV